jgi:glycosyltransferase involved in cell wall biosynthesis
MPIYNGQRYLAPAIDSVLDQTFTDFELIAIDDGSRDRSLEILNQYAGKDRRVRVVSRANTGIVGALNDGIAAARAPLIARMDADDVCLPQRFEKQFAYLSEHPECVLLGTQVLLVDDEGAPIRVKSETKFNHEQIDHAHLNRSWPMVHPTVMMRVAALQAAGGYREGYKWLEDLDLFLRMAEVGRLANLPEVLLHYRMHLSSVCHTHKDEQAELRVKLYAETWERRGLPQGDLTPPTSSIKTESDQHRLWAWWALQDGNLRTARKHAFRSVRKAPFHKESWRVLACAIRGR